MKTNTLGFTAKEVAEKMVVNGKLKVGLIGLGGSSLKQVDKITASGRIYFKDCKFKYCNARIRKGKFFWITKHYGISKPDGYVESFDDTCTRTKARA